MSKYNKAYEALKALNDEYLDRIPDAIINGERNSNIVADIIVWNAVSSLMKQMLNVLLSSSSDESEHP